MAAASIHSGYAAMPRRRRPGAAVLLLAALAATVGAARAGAMPAEAYVPAVEAFLTQSLDPARTVRVGRTTLRRPSAEFALDGGTLSFATPVLGRVCAAVYSGPGIFRFEPGSAFERREVARFFDAERVERPISSVVLLFFDQTESELEAAATGGAASVAGPAQDGLREYLQLTGDRAAARLREDLALELLNGTPGRSFCAYIRCDDGERLFYEVRPDRLEDVTFWRVPRSFTGRWSLDDRDLVSRFVSDSTRIERMDADEARQLDLDHLDLRCRFSETLGFSASATLAVRYAADGATWTALSLHPDLKVDSASWNGTPAGFVRPGGSSLLWVRTPAGARTAGRASLRVVYGGPIMSTAGDWMWLKSSIDWYPWASGARRATFDLAVESPARLHLSASGTPVERRERGGVLHTRWTVTVPTRNVTMVIGRFEERTVAVEDAPAVRGLFYSGRPDRITWDLGERKITMGTPLETWVVEDAARAAQFFATRFGPPPVGGMCVAQIPSLHGEAFPGLINIPETAFVGETAVAEDQVFRGHEVAHQWWAFGVDARSYHDHWLIEGFANFAGLWYLQEGLGRQRDYLAVLRRWKDALIEDRRTRPEGGRVAGPIWLGYRNRTSARPSDYVLADYLKGAWVLHMLRTMLLDLRTMEDHGFSRIMSEFYAAHRGGDATTDDLRRTAEAVTHVELGWFFDQWVYGAEIPSFRWASRVERTGDGRHVVHIRVRPRRVTPGFRMPVVIRLDFGNDRFAWVRRDIGERESEIVLPAVAEQPVAIVFNDIESVLAEVREEVW